MRRLACLVLLTGCSAAPPSPTATAPPPAAASAGAHSTPLPPLPATLVAASSELDQALRAVEPVRSQRIARARGAIESVVGRRAERRAAKDVGYKVCGLATTRLGVFGATNVTTTRGQHFIDFDGKLLRFDPEMRVVSPAPPASDAEDPPGLDPARFVWIGGTSGRLVDLETNAIVMQSDDPDGVVFRGRSGRLRVLGGLGGAKELRSLPSGKVLFHPDHALAFPDDVAGIVATVDAVLEGPSWLVLRDAEDGRELRRIPDVHVDVFLPTRVTVSRDGRALALNASGVLTLIDASGRRFDRKVGDGARLYSGPYLSLDGKRACSRTLVGSAVLPVESPVPERTFCAVSWPTELHGDAVIVTVKPDPPWRILSGPAPIPGNMPRRLGASAASSDGLRAAVVETAKPLDGWQGEGRVRLVDARTGSTLQTWPFGKQSLHDLWLRFVAGDSALVLDGGDGATERFEIGESAARAAAEPIAEEVGCPRPTAWDPWKDGACVIGPVMGPSALCDEPPRR